MNFQNKVLIITADTLIGLGLKTVLVEHFGLMPSYLSSWNEIPESLFRVKEFQIIFCEEKNIHEIPHHFSRLLQKKIVLIHNKNHERILKYRSFDVNQSFENLLTEISSLLNLQNGNDENSNSQLTPREIEVLKLLACGYINKEIADALSISPHTVISHRKNISAKLGIKTVSGLTVYATINKLISPDSIL